MFSNTLLTCQVVTCFLWPGLNSAINCFAKQYIELVGYKVLYSTALPPQFIAEFISVAMRLNASVLG